MLRSNKLDSTPSTRPKVSLRLGRFSDPMRQHELMIQPVVQFPVEEKKGIPGLRAGVPTVYCFLMDISGSMSGGKINRVKDFLTIFPSSSQIGDQDFIEIITYNETAQCIYRGRRKSPPEMKGVIDPIKATGRTSFEAPFKQINPIYYDKNVQFLIIGLTDGENDRPEAAPEVIRSGLNASFTGRGYQEPRIVFVGISHLSNLLFTERFNQPATPPLYAEDSEAIQQVLVEALKEKEKEYIEISWSLKTAVKVRSKTFGQTQKTTVFNGEPFVIGIDELEGGGGRPFIQYYVKVGEQVIPSSGHLPLLKTVPYDPQLIYSSDLQRMLRIQAYEHTEFGLSKAPFKSQCFRTLKAQLSATMHESEPKFRARFSELIANIDETVTGWGGDQNALNKARLLSTGLGLKAVTTVAEKKSMSTGVFREQELKQHVSFVGEDKVLYKVSTWRQPGHERGSDDLVALTDQAHALPHPDVLRYGNDLSILVNPLEFKLPIQREFKSTKEIIRYVKEQAPIYTSDDPTQEYLAKLGTPKNERVTKLVLPNEIALGTLLDKSVSDPFTQVYLCSYILALNIKNKNSRIPEGSVHIYQAWTDDTPFGQCPHFFCVHKTPNGQCYWIDSTNDEAHEWVNVADENSRQDLIDYYKSVRKLPGVARTVLALLGYDDYPGFFDFPGVFLHYLNAPYFQQAMGIPDDLMCPLNGSLMMSPVFFKENTQQAFDRAAAEKWLAECKSDLLHPITKQPVSGVLIPANRIIVRIKYILQSLPFYLLVAPTVRIEKTLETTLARLTRERDKPQEPLKIKSKAELDASLEKEEKNFKELFSSALSVPFEFITETALLTPPVLSSSSSSSSSMPSTYSSSSSSSSYVSTSLSSDGEEKSSTSRVLLTMQASSPPSSLPPARSEEKIEVSPLPPLQAETPPSLGLPLGADYQAGPHLFSTPAKGASSTEEKSASLSAHSKLDYGNLLKASQQARSERMAKGMLPGTGRGNRG